MTASGYILASLGLLVCIGISFVAFMSASVNSFAPTPTDATNKTARMGCVSLLIMLAIDAWFIGVLWNGNWFWLAD